MAGLAEIGRSLVLGSALLVCSAPASRANEVNVDCFGNGDGTVSCQRLSDGEWFDCARSVGGVSTCRSREVVPGRDDPITCTNNGAGVFSCTSLVRNPAGSAMPGTSVFGF